MDLEAEREIETRSIAEVVSREKEVDLEAVEFFIRGQLLQAGARCLERFINEIGQGRRREPVMCLSKTHLPRVMESRGLKKKTIKTVLGPITMRRSRFVCSACGKTRYVADELLGVAGWRVSPGVRRMMSRAGAQDAFAAGAEDLRLYAGLKVDAKEIERVAEDLGRVVDDWMARQASAALLEGGPSEPIDTLYVSYDGTGVPMRRQALEGVVGKAPDGKPKTREVKLGCVFTQTTLDEHGRPVRDPASTTYVGAIEDSTDFGYRIHAEAVRRGLNNARRVVILIDAQGYNKTIAEEHFPMAIVIIDLYHARERLADFVRDICRLDLEGTAHRKWRDLLDLGLIETLTDQMRAALPRNGPRRKEGLGQIAYFLNNIEAMRYGQFRKDGLFVGSGVIEAGCKTVIGKRLKQSGMFWSIPGANAIIALRCCILSGRFADFWEDVA